ncbi:MAG: hypothetical protein ACFFCM_12200 [Promethearchaeota archaeon]
MILKFIGFVDLTIEPILWFIVSAIFFMQGIYFMNKFLKSEKEAQPFFGGVMIFMYGWGFSRLLETIRRYYVGYYYDIIDMNYNITGSSLILRLLYVTVSYAAIACFFYVTENKIFDKKTHSIFTISTIFQIVLSDLIYFNIPTLIPVIILFFIIGIFPICIFFGFAISKFGEKRIPWVLLGIGMTLFVLGVAGDNPEAYEIVKGLGTALIHYGTPLFVISGSIIITIAFLDLYR